MEPPQTQDCFSLFDLPPAFDIDLDTLTARYRRLQQLIHPDRYSTAGEQERRLAAQHAARINAAYQTLKDPLARARHLLELRGADVEKTGAVDPAFLMEQMALREQLAALRAGGSQAALHDLLADIDQRLQACCQRLGRALQEEGALDTACRLYQEFQFLRRLHEEALDLEERMGNA